MGGNVRQLYRSLARVKIYKHFRAQCQGLEECMQIVYACGRGENIYTFEICGRS